MRLIIILVALAIVGWLAATRLNQAPDVTQAGGGQYDSSQPPRVPTRPQDVKAFQQNMNQYMIDQGKAQQQRIDQQAQ